ncbi:MAG: SIR2 family protein [Myxococcaceae bacterium]
MGNASAFTGNETRLLCSFLGRARQTCDGYEKALDAVLAEEGDVTELLFALNRLITFTFNEGTEVHEACPEFSEYPDGYDELVGRVGFGPDWMVISFNYDTLFEQALRRAGVSFLYPGVEFGEPGKERLGAMRVYKPHGSCNWFHVPNDEFVYGNAKATVPTGTNVTGYSVEGRVPSVNFRAASADWGQMIFERLSRLAPGDPIMAHYCSDKASTLNHATTIVDGRASCLEDMKAVREAIVVGVCLPAAESDAALTAILKALPRGQATNYVNPDPGDAEEAKRYAFKVTCWSFRRWVESL